MSQEMSPQTNRESESDSRPAGFGAPELRCIGCGAVSHEPARDFRCPACADLLEAVYPTPHPEQSPTLPHLWRARKTSLAPADQSGVWRFRELLPILPNAAAPVTLREGNTPVYSMPRCAQSSGLDSLLAKHQGMNPTGSFKDTGMTAALSVAKAKGFEWVGCASTGNTSASMAAYAARAGMRALVLLPEGKISWGKLAQAIDYGAHTLQLRTDFDGCIRVLLDIIRDFPLYLLNSMNPYRLEGQKTTAFELMEQLDWRVPHHVIVPGGNLANSSAIGKGFLEMRSLGLIPRLPRISIIQAAGANPLVRSMREFNGQRMEAVQAETRATAIRIGNPASWKKAVAILRETGGACEEVSEAEIAAAKMDIGLEGIGCEPASAATLAGLRKLTRSGFVQRADSVVLILTGHTLKDPEFTLDQRKPALAMDAGAAAVIRLLQSGMEGAA